MASLQDRAMKWAVECFGEERANSRKERNLRFIEEAIELVQSLDLEKEELLAVVDYVYSRRNGRPEQEVGGVMVTLVILCAANGIHAELSTEREFARCIDKIDFIRERNLQKPRFEKDV